MSMGVLNEYSTWQDVLRFAGTRGDRDWVYIITGKPGPTGKTFLYNKLKNNGYNVYEISEDMFNLVVYHDNRNHYEINYDKKQVLIMLNRAIDVKYIKRLKDAEILYDCFQNPHRINYDLPPSPQFVEYPKCETTVIKMLKKLCDSKIEVIPLSEQKLKPQIKNVIFNDPATIIFWSDGTKTVVKSQEGETFDPEKGLAMAISKKALGNKREYYHTFIHWLKKYQPKKYICMYCGTDTTNPAWDHVCDECVDAFEFCQENYKKYNKKYNPVQAAYDLLVKIRDTDENVCLDEVIGYLGEALEE